MLVYNNLRCLTLIKQQQEVGFYFVIHVLCISYVESIAVTENVYNYLL